MQQHNTCTNFPLKLLSQHLSARDFKIGNVPGRDVKGLTYEDPTFLKRNIILRRRYRVFGEWS